MEAQAYGDGVTVRAIAGTNGDGRFGDVEAEEDDDAEFRPANESGLAVTF